MKAGCFYFLQRKLFKNLIIKSRWIPDRVRNDRCEGGCMDQKSVLRNIRLYRYFVLFNEPLFWGPILILALNRLGKLSLSDIYFVESAAMCLCVLLNIPAGALADLIGRKRALIIGRGFLLVYIICFAAMSSSALAIIGNFIWAVGYSFQSGADVSLLYHTLQSAGMEKEFKKIEGAAVGSRLLLMAVCALAVGPLAEISLRIPILLSVPFVAIPLVLSFFFAEPEVKRKYSAREQFRVLKEGISYAARKREIRWIVGFAVLLLGASKIWFFAYNPYFELVGIELRYFGFIFFLLNIVAWLSSRYAYQIERSLSEQACVTGMVLLVGVPVLLMGLFPVWFMAYLILSQNVVRGFIGPFKGDFLNRHIASDHIRTTVLSVQSSTGEIIAILSLAGFGALAGRYTLPQSLIVLGLLVLIFGALSFWRYKSLPPDTQCEQPSSEEAYLA
jgi:MFS family permease